MGGGEWLWRGAEVFSDMNRSLSINPLVFFWGGGGYRHVFC